MMKIATRSTQAMREPWRSARRIRSMLGNISGTLMGMNVVQRNGNGQVTLLHSILPIAINHLPTLGSLYRGKSNKLGSILFGNTVPV